MYIIIGASRNNKIGSKLIQWWLGTTYSHVYATWYLNSQDRDIVYQASHGMVHFEEYSNFKKQNQVVIEFKIPVTDSQFLTFSKKCIDLAGQPYSKVELVQIFLSQLTKGKIKFRDQKGYICSELVIDLLVNFGINFEKDAFLVTPKDIVTLLKNRAI